MPRRGPERLTCSLRAAGADDGVLADEKGLKAVFGDPASGAEVADVAFIYEARKGE